MTRRRSTASVVETERNLLRYFPQDAPHRLKLAVLDAECWTAIAESWRAIRATETGRGGKWSASYYANRAQERADAAKAIVEMIRKEFPA
jgi:hypothetical protein